MSQKPRTGGMPSEQELLDFIRDFPGKVTKRDIARAFGLRGADKITLKKMLRDLMDAGKIAKDPSKALRSADQLPNVAVVEFDRLDHQGDVLLKIVDRTEDGKKPTIYLVPPKRKTMKAMGPGDRALARLALIKKDPPLYSADIIKMLQSAPDTILGVFRKGSEGGRIHPVSKKDRNEYVVAVSDTHNANDGDLVSAEAIKRSRRRSLGPKMARVTEILGDVQSARAISMIAIKTHDIPFEFPEHVIKAAQKAQPVTLGDRTDLRDIPLITIDPADARDHDDAIWAEADTDPKNPDGWHVIVAIADVAHYVRPGSPLDKEAKNRGNSCYFPDRVVPMLPEDLSADLCSLMPGADRACMAVHMWFDANGNKTRHKFVRGLMRSHANISYQETQRALDGDPDEKTRDITENILKPLHGAFKSLMKAHSKRQPLDLDIPERKIELDEHGNVKAITLRERFDAHRIVEEFMIAANVAAAEELEKHKVPAMYRVHEEPSLEKLESLREFLGTLDLSLTRGAVMKPVLFNGILNKVKDTTFEHMVNEVVLRTQTQAYYSPENMGHFGLALPRYAHFTSPIRRYADLIVHRGLIKALGLGDDGLTHEEITELEKIGEHISDTERRAMAAERESTDRYLASYLSEHVGDQFVGRITGVTRFGLFVTIEPSGGDGLIPISAIGPDYYELDEARHTIVGRDYGQEFTLGDKVDVRLMEANEYTGGLRLELADQGDLPDFVKKPIRRRGRPDKSGGRPAGSAKNKTGGKRPGTNAKQDKKIRKKKR
ncbi:ribonuclease R [Kordiimonas sediminis]|uniref:Ribonuclease R n=1 Tax=Kordiimonas sediminis TaxID=1735581 RepID=A0A919AU62_9PROT|nr:ribonuclease R [Kordiimonas sediminis]GHF25754.1 ribonuclease R [Kordiimonas sediminis]